MSEIVVTGLGVWTAAGATPDELWTHAVAGSSSARWSQLGDTHVVVCPAPEPPPFPGFPPAHHLDRSVRLALAAAQAAYRMARLDLLDPPDLGIIVGSSRGPVELWSAPPRSRVRPTQAMHTAVGALSGALSLALQARGPCFTVSATCASGAHAIAVGASLLASGLAQVMLVGGAEAPLTPGLLAQYAAAGLLGSDPDPALTCRPFDARRNGMVPGEGAAFLVLESRAHALARGLEPLASLAGFALGAESYRRAGPRLDGSGLADTMTRSLARAHLAPEQVGYINAHGTGTRANDLAEAAALASIFGRPPTPPHSPTHASRAGPAISSTKAVTGHTFGAAAAVEAVLAILALRHQTAPSTVGCLEPDPTLPIEVVRGAPQPIRTDYVMSNSLGFWGNTASLIFGRP